MSLEFDRAKVINWVEQRWGKDKRCPVCGRNNWAIMDMLVELREFRRGGLVVGGATVPLLSVTCTYCANTLLLNALVVGLIEQEPDAKGEPEESEGSGDG